MPPVIVGGANCTVIVPLPAIVEVTVGEAGKPIDAGETLALNVPKIVDVVVEPGFDVDVAPEVIALTLTVLIVPKVLVE
jgi:hypothetical protein